jgi:hypothetical protein
MLNSRLLLDLPYDQSRVAIGYRDIDTYKDDQYAHLDLLGYRTALINAADIYADSYDSVSTKTVLHFRDYLISKAITYTLRSLIYTDNQATSLTAHTDKALTFNTTQSLYSNNLRDRDNRLGDKLGSLAYYLIYVDTEGYPIEYLERLLTYVWGLVGLNYSALPKDRLKRLFKLIGRSSELDNIVLTGLDKVLAAKSGDDEYVALLETRRNFITKQDASDYSMRVLTGKYTSSLLPILASVLSEQQNRLVAGYTSNVLSMFKPIGFNLLVQSFAVEGLVKAAKAINALPESQLNRPLTEFLSSASDSEKSSVAAALATTVDALEFMTEYNIYNNLTDEAEKILEITYAWTPPAVYAKDPIRLYSLFDTRDINSNNASRAANTLAKELTQLGALGSKSLSVSSSANYTSSSVITAVNNTDTSSLIIFFVIGNSLIPASSVNVIPTKPNAATTTKQAKVSIPDDGAIAVVAASDIPIADGTELRVDQFIQLRNYIKETGQGSISEVLVVESLPTPEPASTAVNELVSDQFTNYSLYNRLTATSVPRGSVNSRYESQGVTMDALTTGQITQSYGYREEGYLDEYAGRMAGLSRQQKNTHINSEVRVLKSWAKALKDIANPPSLIPEEVIPDAILPDDGLPRDIA